MACVYTEARTQLKDRSETSGRVSLHFDKVHPAIKDAISKNGEEAINFLDTVSWHLKKVNDNEYYVILDME